METMNNDQLLELLKSDVNKFNQYRKEYSDQKIDLYEADLYKLDLRYADLYKVDLYHANLIGADLRDANLTDANLKGAKQ